MAKGFEHRRSVCAPDTPVKGLVRAASVVARRNGSQPGAEGNREPSTFGSGLLPSASPAFASEAGKQKTTPKDRSDSLICLKKIGAGEGIRTLDPDLGKVVLYP
jgi:hypothetical protein